LDFLSALGAQEFKPMVNVATRTVPLKTILRLNAERTIPLDRYEEEGAFDRFGYLEGLADQNDVEFDVVLTLVDVLGPEEDFDGLVTTLEDML
jgi:hypothetical protein